MTPAPLPEKPEPQAQFHTLPEDELFAALGSSPNGLTSGQAQAGLLRFGNNDISHIKKVPVILQFLDHFKNLLVIILLIAAAISLFVGEMTDAVIIFVIVIASVTLDFFQEYKAGNAAELLRQKILTQATVFRDGKEQELPITGLVPGDIISLAAGDIVPADARILTARTFTSTSPHSPANRSRSKKIPVLADPENPADRSGQLHLPWHVCCQRDGNSANHKDRGIDRVWQGGKDPCRTPPGDRVRTGPETVQLPDVEIRLLPRHLRVFHQCPVPPRHPRIPALLRSHLPSA